MHEVHIMRDSWLKCLHSCTFPHCVTHMQSVSRTTEKCAMSQKPGIQSTMVSLVDIRLVVQIPQLLNPDIALCTHLQLLFLTMSSLIMMETPITIHPCQTFMQRGTIQLQFKPVQVQHGNANCEVFAVACATAHA